MTATFDTAGELDRSALPPTDPGVRDAGAGDIEALAAISREVRGAPHTLELEYALANDSRLLRFADRGFAVVVPGRSVWLLVARDERAASALLWSALDGVGETVLPLVRWITPAQQWAVDLLRSAGLTLTAHGALCWRGRPGPLRPFIPSGPFA